MRKIYFQKDISHLSYGERLAYLRSAHGYTQDKILSLLKDYNPNDEITQSTLSGYERGTIEMKLSFLDFICHVFHITPDYFITGKPPQKKDVSNLTLSAQEEDFLFNLRKMSPEAKCRCLGVMDYLVARIDGDIKYNPVIKEIPLIGETACGKPIEAIEHYDETVETDEMSADFALIAKGKSMYPLIKDGDIMLIKTAEQLDNGDIGVFQINITGFSTDNEVTCKEYYDLGNGIIELHPINTRSKTIEINLNNPEVTFNIVGKFISTLQNI